MGASQLTPWGQPQYLYVTDTQRKRNQLLREASDAGTFAPQATTFAQWLDDAWTRFGDGRRVLSSDEMAALAMEVLDTHPELGQSFDALGGRAETCHQLVAIERLVGETATPLKALAPAQRRVEEAIAALRQSADRQTGAIRHVSAREALLRLIANPSPAFGRALGRHPFVLIDDLIDARPLQDRLLIAACRAWAAQGARVVLSIMSPRIIGVEEAEALFAQDGRADRTDVMARELRPYQATQHLRSLVMDEWLSSGEATLVAATNEGPVLLEPGAEGAKAGAVTPLVHWARGTAIDGTASDVKAAFASRGIRFVRAENADIEADGIADDIVSHIASGGLPEDCIVAHAGSSMRFERALTARGVSFHVDSRAALGTLPVGDAVRSLGTLAVEPLDARVLCALLWFTGTPRAHPTLDPVAVSDALLRKAGLSDQPIDRWEERLDDPSLIREIEAFLEPLAKLARRQTAHSWTLHLRELIDHYALQEASSVPDAADTWTHMDAALEAFEAGFELLGHREFAPEILLDALSQRLANTSGRSRRPQTAAVSLVGVSELRGLTAPYTWVAGLTRSQFPRSPRRLYLLDADVERRLQRDPSREARMLLATLTTNAWHDDSMHSLTLSFAESVDDAVAKPSTALASLFHLPLGSGATSLGDAVITRPWGRTVSPAPPPPEQSVGQRDGHLLSWSLATNAVSPSAIDSYHACPQRFWYERVLKLERDDPWSADPDPRDRGSTLHAIVERYFSESHLRAVWRETDEAEARARLCRIAIDGLDTLARETGVGAPFIDALRHEWLSGLTDGGPKGLLRAWFDSEEQRGVGWTPLAVERRFEDVPLGPLRLRGTIDRIDEDADGNLFVTDYKTGDPPATKDVKAGRSLQLILYVHAVQNAFPDRTIASAYRKMKKPSEVRVSGLLGPPDAVDAAAGWTANAGKRGSTKLSPEDANALIETATQAAVDLASGCFPLTPHPEFANCDRCAFRTICRTGDAV